MNRRHWLLSALALSIVIILIFGLAGCQPAVPEDDSEPEAVVRALFFWAETCPYCHMIMDEFFPVWEAEHGDQLEITTVDVAEPEEYELWVATMKAFEVPRGGVPMLVVGDEVLIGAREIPERFPGLIETYLAQGGVGYPDVRGLEDVLGVRPGLDTGAANPSEGADEPIHLAYFDQVGCPECGQVQLHLNYLKHQYPQLVIHTFDVRDEAVLAEWLGERAGVPERKRMTAPAVFVGDQALVGDEVNPDDLDALIAHHTDSGAAAPWGDAAEAETDVISGIIERFGSFGLLTVLVAGLVDGLNPCAFATLVFFIAYLTAMGRKGREVLLAGAAFTLAVFLTYLGVGIGVLRFLAALPFLDAVSRWIYGFMAAFCLILAVGSLYDWWKVRRGKAEEMALKMPTRLRKRVNQAIRKRAGARAFVPVTFVTGAVVSIIELACTGQVYLPTILFVLGVPEMQAQAGLYLVLYNVMFVVPLIVVFGLAYFGSSSQQLGLFIHRHTAKVKLATAGLFLLLASWMVVTLATLA